MDVGRHQLLDRVGANRRCMCPARYWWKRFCQLFVLCSHHESRRRSKYCRSGRGLSHPVFLQGQGKRPVLVTYLGQESRGHEHVHGFSRGRTFCGRGGRARYPGGMQAEAVQSPWQSGHWECQSRERMLVPLGLAEQQSVRLRRGSRRRLPRHHRNDDADKLQCLFRLHIERRSSKWR